MKRPFKFNLTEENEHHKQKAQFLTSNRNYREVINCYENIAKNIKIEKKAEEDKASKNLLKSKLYKIKKLIKDLKTVSNASNEFFSSDKYFLFKDLQESYYLFENLGSYDDIFTEQIYTEQDEIFQIRESENRTTPNKNCYACKCEITWNGLKTANPSLEEDYLKKLFENPYIEFYCCECLFKKTPNSVVRDLVCYLNFLEKNIKYPIKKLWNLEWSGLQQEELKSYLNEINKIKNTKPNDFTQDTNLISLIKELIPNFILQDSTIKIQQTVLYEEFKDYEKEIIFIARGSPFFGEAITGDYTVSIPKRFQTSDSSKAKGFYYKNKRGRNMFKLTSFGRTKFVQIYSQIEEKIDAFLKLSNTFNVFFNL